jgi:REP element-mobilizing transposase RayT
LTRQTTNSYRDLLAENAARAGVEVWARHRSHHVHLILVPSDAYGLRRCLAPTHHRYAGVTHGREKRTGHFWLGRFGCVAMDEAHLGAASRYVTLNPERRTDYLHQASVAALSRLHRDDRRRRGRSAVFARSPFAATLRARAGRKSPCKSLILLR